jgi:uncharacterized protein
MMRVTPTGRRIVLLVASALAWLSCTPDREGDAPDQRIIPFDSVTLRVATRRDTVPLQVELAITPAQRQLGLMERRHLPDSGGMLFVFDSTQPAEEGFWMYRTRIPLDIAFVDSAGVIRSMRQMVPCETSLPEGCPTYPSEVPYRFALEVKAGLLRGLAMDTGDVLLLHEIPALAARLRPRSGEPSKAAPRLPPD